MTSDAEAALLADVLYQLLWDNSEHTTECEGSFPDCDCQVNGADLTSDALRLYAVLRRQLTE